MSDVLLDGPDQIGNAAEDTSSNALRGELAEEAFDEIQPGRAGRSEVYVEARMFRQPPSYRRMFVRCVVVDDQVEVVFERHLLVDSSQELEPLLMPMPRHALADHVAGEEFDRSE